MRSETAPVTGTRDGRAVRHHAYVLVSVLVVAAMVASFAWRVLSVDAYSGLDEPQHVDAVIQASEGNFPGYGALMSDAVLRDVACRGLDPANVKPPPREPSRYDFGTCGESASIPGENLSYELGQPQLYYVTNALVVRVLGVLGVEQPSLEWLRAINLVWLAPAFFLVLGASRRVAGRWTALAATAAFFLSPAVIESAATVSNDVAVLTVGAGAAVLAVNASRMSPRVLGVAGALVGVAAGLAKSTSLLPVTALVLALGLGGIARQPRDWRSYAVALAPLLGWVVATGLWGSYVTSVSSLLPPDLPPFSDLFARREDLWPALLRSARPLVPLVPLYSPGINEDSLLAYQLPRVLVGSIVLLGVGSALLRWRAVVDCVRARRADHQARVLYTCIASASVLVVGGMGLVLLTTALLGFPHPVYPRFALGMVGLLAVTFAAQSSRGAQPGFASDSRPALPLLVVLVAVSVVSLAGYVSGVG